MTIGVNYYVIPKVFLSRQILFYGLLEYFASLTYEFFKKSRSLKAL